jgi:hypothetical protein
VYVHINLLFEGFSVMKGAVGFQGETGGSLPLVVVANATNAKLKAGIQSMGSESLILYSDSNCFLLAILT